MTNRREFITLLGGAAACPLAARAQQGERVRRIGVLMPYDENDPEAKLRLSAFTQGLSEFGWTYGRNVRMAFVGPAVTAIEYERSRTSWSACNPTSL
jgi:putative ABC transport system substrate-binding protein